MDDLKCGVCTKYRRRCSARCVYWWLFPDEEMVKSLIRIDYVYGERNFKNMVNKCKLEERPQLISSLSCEADARFADPLRGSEKIVADLEEELRRDREPLAIKTTRCLACICFRRNCGDDCLFKQFIPGDNNFDAFLNIKNVFKISFLDKQLRKTQNESMEVRNQVVDSFVWEATYRMNNPVTGCNALVMNLRAEAERLNAFLNNFDTP